MANRNARPADIQNRRQWQSNEDRGQRHTPDNYREDYERGQYRSRLNQDDDPGYRAGHPPYGTNWRQHGHYQDRNIDPQRYPNRQHHRQSEDFQDYAPSRNQDPYDGYAPGENRYADPEMDRSGHYGYRETPNRRQERYHQNWRDNDRNWRNRDHEWRDDDRNWWDRTRDEVSSWFGDEDAQSRRRQDMHQNNGTYRGVGPKGYRRSDERIRDDINDRLSDDPYIDASDVEVIVENGEVTLSGTVMSKSLKRRAEDIADSVSAVSNVENRIRLSPFSKEGQKEDQHPGKSEQNERPKLSETQKQIQKRG